MGTLPLTRYRYQPRPKIEGEYSLALATFNETKFKSFSVNWENIGFSANADFQQKFYR